MRITQPVICPLLCLQSIVARATDRFVPLADRLLEDGQLPAFPALLIAMDAVITVREVGYPGAGRADRIVR
jgi:hypothetical protein